MTSIGKMKLIQQSKHLGNKKNISIKSKHICLPLGHTNTLYLLYQYSDHILIKQTHERYGFFVDFC